MVSSARRREAQDESPRPITFRAANEIGALELARLWADPEAWPIGKRSVYDELAELSVMSALINALRAWQPMAIHGALREGARPEAIAAALGDNLETAYEQWRAWALRQRDLIVRGKPALSAEEYGQVRSCFARAGIGEATTA